MDTISHSCLRAAQYKKQNSFSWKHLFLYLSQTFMKLQIESQQYQYQYQQYKNNFSWKHIFSICPTHLWNLKLVEVNKIKYLYFRVSRNYSISPALDRYWTSFDKCNSFSPTLRLILFNVFFYIFICDLWICFLSVICEFVPRICFLAGMNPWGTISMLQRPW